MRGHGFVAAARSLIEVVRMSVYVPRNARVQYKALQLGQLKPLSPGEIEARNAGYKPYSPETWRAWEYWATRAGCAHLLSKES
jgi:HCOMODA/2-hydroxy-3-carboxy-muconic semialdehyde decarboxylase